MKDEQTQQMQSRAAVFYFIWGRVGFNGHSCSLAFVGEQDHIICGGFVTTFTSYIFLPHNNWQILFVFNCFKASKDSCIGLHDEVAG